MADKIRSVVKTLELFVDEKMRVEAEMRKYKGEESVTEAKFVM